MIAPIQFNTFFERNSLGMAFINQEEQLIEVNDALCRLTGYSRDELLLKKLLAIYAVDNIFISPSKRELMHKGEVSHVQVERKIITKSGSYVYANIHITVVLDTFGNFEYELGVFEDISAQKQVEKQLHDLEIRFGSVYEFSPIAIVLCDTTWNILTVNAKACNLFGYSQQELKKMNLAQISHPDYVDANKQIIATKLKEGEDSFFMSQRYIQKSGSVIDGELTANIIYDEQKKPLYIMSMVVDITQRKQRELELQKSELMYSSLVKNIPGVVYNCIEDDHWTMLYLSEQVEELTGYTSQEFINNDISFSDIILPNDYEKLINSYADKDNIKLGDTFNEYYRIKHANGAIRWIHEKGQYFDKKGDQWFLYGLMFDITEQKEQENNLFQSQMRFKSVFENSNLPIIIADIDGNIIEGNIAFCRLTGYSMQEITEMTLHEFAHLDSDRTSTEDAMDFVSGNVKWFSNLNRMIRTKNGKKRYVSVNLSGIYNEQNEFIYGVSIIEDVTEKRQFTQALNESIAMQQAILKSLPDLTFHLDATGKYLNAYIPDNLPTEIYISPHDIVGKQMPEILPLDLAKQLQILISESLTSNKVLTYEYELTINGVKRQYEALVNAINSSEVLLTARNITPLKEIQAVLAAKVSELENKNEELEKYISSNLELENFAYVASHDLREPLRSIIGFSQLLKQKLGNSDDYTVLEYLQFIRESAQQMSILINDLLQYSLVNTEHIAKPIRTILIVEKTMLNMRELIHKTKAVINIGALPDIIVGYEPKLSQVFQNLIQNAIKFHQPNMPPTVNIASFETPTHWHFSVADNGIGIDIDYFDKIFLLFRRLHTRNEFSGSGLGLAICKKIVEQHHGHIWVESELGHGTTFFFTIAKP